MCSYRRFGIPVKGEGTNFGLVMSVRGRLYRMGGQGVAILERREGWRLRGRVDCMESKYIKLLSWLSL